MHLVFGWDHAGLPLGRQLVDDLNGKGHTTEVHGAPDETSVDYPDFVPPVAAAILAGRARFGVLLCGTGIGMSLSANRIPSIRAALCVEGVSAHLSRAHNDANVLCLGGRIVGVEVALSLLDIFITTPFAGGRHQRRLDKLAAIAQRPS